MKLKHFLFLVLLMVVSMAQAQMEMPPVPVDPEVRTGKLDNGLTYFIRHNNWPEHRANFYIAQKVGSIQEEESQRGLAHFLEHMAFNGSDNFKGNDLIRYCESIGVQFGRDLNAYTSIDQTVYNIDNVPTTRFGAVDSCLLILRDWADGLTLDPEEIDKGAWCDSRRVASAHIGQQPYVRAQPARTLSRFEVWRALSYRTDERGGQFFAKGTARLLREMVPPNKPGYHCCR